MYQSTYTSKVGSCLVLLFPSFVPVLSNMSTFSSPGKSSHKKPLNPLAPIYNPRNTDYLPHQFYQSHYEHLYEARAPSGLSQAQAQAQAQAQLPPQVPAAPEPVACYPYPNINLYNPADMQPYQWDQPLYTPYFIPYGVMWHGSESEQKMFGRKNCGKSRLIPPRLKSSKRVWVIKGSAKNGIVDLGVSPVAAEEQTELGGKTSIMIKNIPNHLKRAHLQQMLDDHCLTENTKAEGAGSRSEYDFLYLPMDFSFHLNLGFAFVNFTSPVAALRFYNAFNNREWSIGDGRKKICQICVAKLQGIDALKEQFERSSFPCYSNQYLPVVFSPPRDGFKLSRPKLVGRRTYPASNAKDQKVVMIMTKRKNKKV